MVNEVNKPPAENAQLEQRLVDSNRQLHAMQEEHRQLMEEMQMLRQRAAELSQRNAQEHITDSILNQSTRTATQSTTETSTIATSSSVASTSTASKSVLTDETEKTTAVAAKTSNEGADEKDGEDNAETAAYLSEKLAEIAALKARFHKVQNMMKTTELIENHVAKCSASNANEDIVKAVVSSPVVATSPAVTAQFEERNEELLASMISALSNFNVNIQEQSHSADGTTTTDPIPDENHELLSTMFNMFTNFTADLRNQATDLRAERERIAALKEELQRRKRGN